MKKSGFLFLVIAVFAIAFIGFHAEAIGATYDCSSTCQVCHTAQSAATLSHPGGPGTPVMCMECHQQNRVMCSDTVGGPVHSGDEIDIVAIACAGCHSPGTCGPIFSETSLLQYAEDIHQTMPTANFTATPDSSTPYKVNFSAASSTCPAGAVCTYSWDFTNDGNIDAAGIAASNTYLSGTPVTVKLTVTTDALISASITKTVTPSTVNRTPTCGNTTIPATGMEAKFTDMSEDVDGNGTAALYVNWGDGSPVQAVALKTADITHTYAYKGTYSVKRYVRDTGGLVNQCEPKSVTVGSTVGSMGYLQVSTQLAKVSIYVKKDGLTKAFYSTAGTEIPANTKTFTLPASAAPGTTYNVYVYPPTGKKCYTSYTSPTVNTPYVNGTGYAVVVGAPTPVALICQ